MGEICWRVMMVHHPHWHDWLIAGTVGIVVGVILGFVSGFFGGPIDWSSGGSRSVVDHPGFDSAPSLLPAPSSTRTRSTYLHHGRVTSLWPGLGPTRVVRSPGFDDEEQTYVSVAKLSGMGNMEIIFKELMPNMLPFLVASFVGQTNGAIYASFGLEILGLGPAREPTDRYDDSLGYLSVGIVQPVVVVGFVARRRHGVDILMPGTDQSGLWMKSRTRG